MTQLSLIVAMDDRRLIGSNNKLPWHLPADLAFFKRTTMGKPLIMGRKTYASIGRPLPGRRNIVVTRDQQFLAAGCDIVYGIEAALALCGAADEVMLIGGASLYQQTLALATRLYITHIRASFDGDTWFPEVNTADWKIENRESHEADSNNPYAYEFVKYVREFRLHLG